MPLAKVCPFHRQKVGGGLSPMGGFCFERAVCAMPKNPSAAQISRHRGLLGRVLGQVPRENAISVQLQICL